MHRVMSWNNWTWPEHTHQQQRCTVAWLGTTQHNQNTHISNRDTAISWDNSTQPEHTHQQQRCTVSWLGTTQHNQNTHISNRNAQCHDLGQLNTARTHTSATEMYRVMSWNNWTRPEHTHQQQRCTAAWLGTTQHNQNTHINNRDAQSHELEQLSTTRTHISTTEMHSQELGLLNTNLNTHTTTTTHIFSSGDH